MTDLFNLTDEQEEIRTFLYLKYGSNSEKIRRKWEKSLIDLCYEERVVLAKLEGITYDELLDLKTIYVNSCTKHPDEQYYDRWLY